MIISVTARLKKFNIVKTSQRRKVCHIALKEACKNLQSLKDAIDHNIKVLHKL